MRASLTNNDPAQLALRALVWTLGEPDRATRLLDVTGMTPMDLRTRADDPVVLAAMLAFLEAHQPDLIACAEALEVRPEDLAAARRALEGPDDFGDYA
ncbi:DUF3572 domain-containing protein [Sphingomonas echinoides]|jgi:hypothetical protein|uniref:DUF3572 domain-containing protein n=1 Tax=Sphingomonas echinoides TaxID=59803 RepID=UPI0024138570|nr:DUF3572 domain-containing protein [Sphingomonas echinoides]